MTFSSTVTSSTLRGSWTTCHDFSRKVRLLSHRLLSEKPTTTPPLRWRGTLLGRIAFYTIVVRWIRWSCALMTPTIWSTCQTTGLFSLSSFSKLISKTGNQRQKRWRAKVGSQTFQKSLTSVGWAEQQPKEWLSKTSVNTFTKRKSRALSEQARPRRVQFSETEFTLLKQLSLTNLKLHLQILI